MQDYQSIKRRLFDTLNTLGRPVFDTRVPEGVQFPFIRYSWIAAAIHASFDDSDFFVRHRLQVDVIDKNEVATTAENLFKQVINILDGLDFAMSESSYRTRLGGTSRTFDPDLKLWYLTGEFIIHRR